MNPNAILDVLRERNVDFVSSGPNVRRGCVAIQCPVCGEADPSKHANINPAKGTWQCWRNKRHGGSVDRLFAKLFHLSPEASKSLVGGGYSDLQEAIQRLRGQDSPPEARQRPIERLEAKERGLVRLTDKPLHNRFVDYLDNRGFYRGEVPGMVKRYDLRCALIGRWQNRIVFPLWVEGKIVGYSGRCVDDGKLRYLSHPGPVVKQNLLWYDSLLEGGDKLFVCEGPFDALKVDWFFYYDKLPHRATCLFGISYINAQLDRIRELAPLYSEVVVLFDREALAAAIGLQQA